MKKNKNNNRIKLIALVVCTFLTVTSFSSAESSVLEKTGKNDDGMIATLIYTRTFSEPKLTKEPANDIGITFTKIVDMPGTFTIGEKPGTPTYQVAPVKLLIPHGKKVTKVSVTSETKEVNANTYGINLKLEPIFPYQPPEPLSEKPLNLVTNRKAYKSSTAIPYEKQVPIDEKPSFALEIDAEAYRSMSITPGKTFESLGVDYCRGYAILIVNLYPTEYIPSGGRLFYHPEMTIKVTLEDDDYVNRFYRTNSDDEAWVKSLVTNPEITETYSTYSSNGYDGGLCDPSDNGGLGYDYVIITREALLFFSGTAYNWDDLIQRKEASGLEATKVSVEEILSCPDYWNTSDPLFNDTAALIREFCKDAYLDWGTQYILIGGDQDGPNAVERRLMTYEFEPYIESDLYWSNLDNTFNADHDEFWGEQGDEGFDLYSELFIGSIPCDEGIDVSNWLTKSFFYEDNYDLDYLDNAAFFTGFLGWICEGDDFIDFSAIKGTDDWLGPDPHYDGPYPEWLGFLYGFETWNSNNPGLEYNLSVKWTAEQPNPGWQGGSTDAAITGMKDAINNDQCTLISAIAHADAHKSMEVYDFDWESQYHNTMPFFVHDYGCHCGDMDAADDGVLHSMLFHSDTELAFACVYNTGYGWGNQYCTNSSSALQQKLFWDYLFDVVNNSGSTKNWQLGKAQAWSKDAMAPTINWDHGSGMWRGIIEGCLLFGDPAQTIKPPIRSEHNVGVRTMEVPSHVKSNEATYVNATIVNNGQNNETNVLMSFRVDDVEVDNTTILFFESQTIQHVSFIWTPTAGLYTITINVTIPGIIEDFYLDNEKTCMVVAGVQNIDTGECFETIQEAIDDTDTLDGHNIVVPPGIYHENVMINKSTSLKGVNQDTTIIDGSGDDVVSIYADMVNISGFTIQHGNRGIIVGEGSVYTTITDNTIIDNDVVGIYLETSLNNDIDGNRITNYSFSGIVFSNSSYNNITSNIIANNYLSYEQYCYGIYFSGSSSNVVTQNTITGHVFGIALNDLSDDNLVYNNNFNNYQNAFDIGSDNQWDCGYLYGPRIVGGNWWSDYNGSDEFSGPNQDQPGSDGIGDIPYNISGGDSQDQYPLIRPWMSPFPGTIYVDDDNTMGPWEGTPEHPYQHIQDGIDAAIDNDTVFVCNGTYYENIWVNKSLSLVGEDRDSVIIDGSGSGTVVYVSLNMMNISGFTIQNSGNNPYDAGIYVISNNNTITRNAIIDNHEGIFFYHSANNNIISENTISDNSIGINFYVSANNNIISENEIKNNRNGVDLSFSSDNHITGNTFIDNSFCGIIDSLSSRNIITGNTISNSEVGIMFSTGSNNNVVSENTITDCMFGVCLEQTFNDIITDNTFLSTGIMIGDFKLQYWNTHTIENNTANGRPIRYYKNTNDIVVPSDTSQIILGNCTNVTIQNLNLSDVDCGIQLGFSSHTNIIGNIVTNNSYGFYVVDSHDSKIISMNIIKDNYIGVYLIFVYNETITGNIITDNMMGVALFNSLDSLISENTINNIDTGIGLTAWSDNNIISRNTISNNHNGIYLMDGSNNNIIQENTLSSNTGFGISVPFLHLDSENNVIYHNNFINNYQNAYDQCNNTWYNATLEEGNYWDDFEMNPGYPDGVYIIPGGDNVDIYPLTSPWTPALDTVYIDDDFNSSTPGWGYDHFDKIQDGIDAVIEGGTVYVYSGIYYENVKVNKSVNLIGEGREYVTVSAASSYDNVFEISDDYVNISGFTVTGDPESTIGIYSASTDNCNVYNNNVMNNHFGIYLDSSDNNTLLNNIVNSNNNSGIALIFSYNNVLINNTANSNIGGGIGLGYSSNNILINNTADSNQEGGIILGASSNNTLLNNTANSNNYYGIYLYFSSNNLLENNKLSGNSKDIYNTGVNIFISNRFFHNLQSCMLTFEDVNRWKNLSDVVRFNISMFNANGDPSDCNYSITTRPAETVLISKDGNNITGNFTLSKLGTYSLLVIITDENNNTAKRRYTFFVNPSGLAKTRYYLRSVDPTHGQPTGSDAGSLLFTPPTEEESWWCSTWIQNSPDELPENYPLSILDDIDIYSWYKTQVEGYMGIQRFVTSGIEVDTSESVEAVAEYTWIHKNFGNLNWSMDYSWTWYLLSLKLKGYMPHWMTIPSQPSYANFTHRYTTTPTIKSISNPDIIILSATSPANNTNNANIVLEGSGTTTLVVQMLNTSLIYSVKLDGIACNNSNCTFTQQNGELNISLRLGSELNEHTLEIKGILPLPDLTITDFTAIYISIKKVKLIATIKNNGTADVTEPFRVSFYVSTIHTNISINSILIGNVRIPSLEAGETAEAAIFWKVVQPRIHILSVFADSTRVINESDETNNWASLTI